mgnify:FL=1
MSMIITEDCINCGACAVECPTEAIFEMAESYKVNGKNFPPLSMEHFFIVTDICDECSQINEIKCMAVCPMDAIKRS